MSIDVSYYYDSLALLDMELEFHENPSPVYIQKKIVECSEKLRRSQKIYLELERALTTSQRNYYIENSQYIDQKKKVLTENEKIKRFPTIKEREAAVEELFSDKIKIIHSLANDVSELVRVENTIKSHQKFLRDVNTNIKTQQRTMDFQMMRLNIVPKDHPDVLDLTEALDAVDDLEREINLEDNDSEETVDTENNMLDIDEDDVDLVVGDIEEKDGPKTPVEVPIDSENDEDSIGELKETPVSESDDFDMTSVLDGLDDSADDTKSSDEELIDLDSTAFDDSDTLSATKELEKGNSQKAEKEEASKTLSSTKEDEASVSDSGIDIDDLLNSLI